MRLPRPRRVPRCPWSRARQVIRLPGQPNTGVVSHKAHQWAYRQGEKQAKKGEPIYVNPLIGSLADTWFAGYRNTKSRSRSRSDA